MLKREDGRVLSLWLDNEVEDNQKRQVEEECMKVGLFMEDAPCQKSGLFALIRLPLG